MADSTTANYGWAYPTVNADANTWGTTLNTAIIAIDAQMHTNAGAACQSANNLSDLASAATARTNLGLGSAATLGSAAVCQSANNLGDVANAGTARGNLGVSATGQDTTYAYRANNLSDLASASAARANLGLGSAATQNTGAFLQPGNNLSDLSSAGSARGNLGLGSIATHNITISSSSPSGGSDGDIWFQYS